MNIFHFKTSQVAFKHLNKYFLNNKEEIELKGGGRYGGQMVSYDNIIEIDVAWVLPTFDFGNMFGYRAQKWNSLCRNYVDEEDLNDLIKRVSIREKKRTKNYNESMVFHNKHGHGKGCLLSLTCTRRQNKDNPLITVSLRSSEITKRLLMDMLLIQRIGEKIYGKEPISLNLNIINMYQNAEAFTMLDNYFDIKKALVYKKDLDTWQKKIIDTLDKFKNCHIDDIKMKVHKRCVRQLQRPNGIPLSGDRPMLAKDLKII